MNAGVNVDTDTMREKIRQQLEQRKKDDMNTNMAVNKLKDGVRETDAKVSPPPPINDSNKPKDVVDIKSIKFFETNNIFQKVDFIGLYFASSWCSQSKPATEALGNAFGKNIDLLLTSKSLQDNNIDDKKKQIGIIYISSDRTQDEFKKIINLHNDWLIPMYSDGNNEETTQLKRMFHTCAEEEESKIKIERKYGIPRLIILDSEKKTVITTDGVNDVLNDGVRALERWKDLKKNMMISEDAVKKKGGVGVPNIV